MVQEVQMLNKKIENINIQRTKAEARVEMLKKQLTQGVAEYKKTYGVDLSDKSFPKLSGKVTAELSKVSGDIKAEYELKSKVVKSIEEGNYEEAYKLLGIEVESTEEVAEAEDTTEVAQVVQAEEEIDLDLGIEEEEEDITETQEEVDMSVEEEDGDFNFGVVLDEEEEEEVEAPKVEEETGIKGQGALEAVMEMTVEDDDDDISIPSMEDDDFGFGDILNGTKFQK